MDSQVLNDHSNLDKAHIILEQQKQYFQRGETRDISFRIEQLNTLYKAIKGYEKKLLDALYKDLRKSEFEAYATEIGLILDEIRFVTKNLKSWAKIEKVKTPFSLFPSKGYIYKEPYGSVLIIAPWNYPFQLLIAPLIGAIAAGNCAVLKPSEYTIHVSQVLAEMIREIYDEEYVCVLQGKRNISTLLVNQPFDHIFFTGSAAVGKIVMEAASKHLTPLTLELGGKSPCIIDRYADIPKAARRVAWGKFLNAGQTCVAPDYLMVHKSIKQPFLQELFKSIHTFYGEDPSTSKDYPRIINTKHFHRLVSLLDRGELLIGGHHNIDDLYISPTVIDHITWDDPIMQEEIFGPLLPIIEFEELEDIIFTVNNHPKPLALYIFSEDKHVQDEILQYISFGGGCINDTVTHVATSYLPFGGVGHSGMGAYHGKASFDVFSHQKSILKKSTKLDIPIIYPPYSIKKVKLLKKLLR
ncbi:MAG: aldehyde dehydrogenase [Bacillota bacterium]